MKDKYLKRFERERIMKKYKDMFDAMGEYDQTRKLPFQRRKLYITLANRTIDKLRAISNESGKSMSRIIEEKIVYPSLAHKNL